jgi:hypothetical protein
MCPQSERRMNVSRTRSSASARLKAQTNERVTETLSDELEPAAGDPLWDPGTVP